MQMKYFFFLKKIHLTSSDPALLYICINIWFYLIKEVLKISHTQKRCPSAWEKLWGGLRGGGGEIGGARGKEYKPPALHASPFARFGHALKKLYHL